jgi:hypothetical protein
MKAIPRVSAVLGLHPEQDGGRPVPEKIKAHVLKAPLLHYIGNRTLYQLRRPVLIPTTGTRHRNSILDAVLRLAAIDPDNPPVPLWNPKNRDAALYRQCWYAWNRSSVEGWNDKRSRKKTVNLFTKFDTTGGRGSPLRVVPLGLTEMGVAQAAQLREHFIADPARNVTNLWIDGLLEDYDVGADMHHQLSLLWAAGALERRPVEGTRNPHEARSCPVFQEQYRLVMEAVGRFHRRSRPVYDVLFNQLHRSPQLARETPDDIHEHLNGYFDVSIARDAFRKRLISGEIPTNRQLANWTARKAISTFRKRSQDPVSRQYRGARTQTEREALRDYEDSLNNPEMDTDACRERLEQVTSDTMNPAPYQQVMQTSRDDITGEFTGADIIVVDPNGEQAILHQVAWNIGMDRLKQVVREGKAGAPDRYEEVLDDMCAAISVADQAEKLGCSPNRVAAIRAETRRTIRARKQTSDDAHRLLGYAVAESHSKQVDFEDEFPTMKDVGRLLGAMVESNRLHLDAETGAYVATPGGEVYFALRHGLPLDARRVLRLINEEPFSTSEDLLEELEEGADIEGALVTLLERHCIRNHIRAYQHVEDGCYVITPAGESILSAADCQLDSDDFEAFLAL